MFYLKCQIYKLNVQDKKNYMQQESKNFLLVKISQRLPTNFIVPGSVPIVFFGNIEEADIATLGLNPSDKEFKHKGKQRVVNRKQLTVPDNQTLTPEQAQKVYEYLLEYFKTNPYKKWFDPMNNLFKFKNKGFVYYNYKIVHLDISPWATSKKWNKLSEDEKKLIIDTSIIEYVLKKQGKIKKLFINGETAFKEFKEALKLKETKEEKYKTKNGVRTNFKIYETEIWGCKVVGWNLYI